MLTFIAVSALSFAPTGVPNTAVVTSRPAAATMSALEPAYTRRAALTGAARRTSGATSTQTTAKTREATT